MENRFVLTFGPSTVLRTGPSILLRISLLTVLLLASCAPAASPAPVQTEAHAAPMTEPPQDLSTPTPAMVEASVMETDMPSTEAPAEMPLAIATSRGSDLEASDPTSVSLNSGELQLVEFFRFT